ncbi:MAG: hypothetical protein HY796_09100 [Elusimicrobia bacterium]|nr:hypothetical protein [Elusimicrobiota bacterium]
MTALRIDADERIGLMETNTNRMLEEIIAAGMGRCMDKLSRSSAGKWSMAGISVFRRSLDEVLSGHAAPPGARAVVYFEISGEYPFTSLVAFRSEDLEIISRGFLGIPFSKLPTLNQPELLFSELGNIILNAFIGALSNALRHSFLPPAPKCVLGEPQYLLEALWMTLDPKQLHNVATVTLDLRCDSVVTRIEVIAVISESLERALVAAEKTR